MKKYKYTIYDVETGGVHPKEDALMSLAMLNIDEKGRPYPGEKDHFYIKNDNNRIIGSVALKINGLDPKEVEKTGMSLKEARAHWDKLTKGVDGFIAHNIAFDAQMLFYNGFTVPYSDYTLDTMNVAWDFWGPRDDYGNLVSAKLADCYKRITGKEPADAHDALYDCLMVARLIHYFWKFGIFNGPLPLYPVYFRGKRDYFYGYGELLSAKFPGGKLP